MLPPALQVFSRGASLASGSFLCADRHPSEHSWGPSANLQGSLCVGLSSLQCPDRSDLPGVPGLSALSPQLWGPLGSSWVPPPAPHPGNSLKADSQSLCLAPISQGSLPSLPMSSVLEPLFHVICLCVLLFLVVPGCVRSVGSLLLHLHWKQEPHFPNLSAQFFHPKVSS